MLKSAAFILAASLAAAPFTALADAPLAMHIGGRTATDANGRAYQWPGTYFEARFKGDRLTLSFDDNVNIFNVYIDGKSAGTLRKPGRIKTELSKLGAGEHTVRLERLTETQGTLGRFMGFSVPKAADALPAPTRARQIEFIGDSYTVGYGNTSAKRQCTQDEIWATTDTQQAYGPVTAKHFDADYQVNAFSGRGIVRNYGGFAGDSLPGLYPYTLFNKGQTYGDSAWRPQVIVIGLGSNDFSTPVHAGEKWPDATALKADYEASYVAFFKGLRSKNPNAFFILTSYQGQDVDIEVRKVADLIKASGETRIDVLGLDDLSRGGCDWHLDLKDDQRISGQLVAYIEAHPELWGGK